MEEKRKINVIYILGNSYSGSTLLSFLIGSHPRIESLGELKFYNRLKRTDCTCGKKISRCEFWSKLKLNEFLIFNQPSFIQKLSIINRTILGFKRKSSKKTYDDFKLLSLINKEKIKLNPNLGFLVDASKSVWRLDYLLGQKELKIFPVFIKREIKGSISSYLKRGKISFIKALRIYLIKNYLIGRYLKVNTIKHITVDHAMLCQNPLEQMKEIGSFLDLDFNSFNQNIREKKYHVFTGNTKTSKQFKYGFSGLDEDKSWQDVLTKRQVNFLTYLNSSFLNNG